MTVTIHVGSKTDAAVIFSIEARGLDQTEARRTTIQFVRARHGISDPIALTEHEAAVRMRQQFLAALAPKMPDLNGNGVPGWEADGRTPCYDNR